MSSPPREGTHDVARLEGGAEVGRFVVIGEIGAGSMGVVLSAYDPKLERKVAIKVVRPGTSSSSLRARLLGEAQTMAKVSHPHVITVYEVGTIGDSVFVAMELVEGGTLSRWLSERPRAWREVVAMFARVGSGLQAAHAAGVVHRDFKPDNVLVGSDGRVRVTDFGLAGVSPMEPPSPADRAELPLAETDMAIGTPLYLAPEQHRGQPVGAQVDQFAFCVALHEALYGARPFSGESRPDLSAAVIAGRVRAAARDADVPARLRRIVLRGLLPDPGDRYPSMEALLADLGRDPGRTWRRAALVAAATALAVWGGVALWQARAADPRLCAGADSRLAGVWDGELKGRAHAAFLATGLAYAEASWQGVARRLDDYAGAWVRMYGDACEATRRGQQSAQVLDLRMTCLSRRRGELVALTQLYATADAEEVERSVSAAAGLTDLAGCADLARLSAPLPLPEAAALHAQVAVVRAQLAVAGTYEALGKYAPALALAEPALAAARQTGYQPLEAEALKLTGRLRTTVGDPAGGERLLFDAVAAAAASGHVEAEADARIDLVGVTGGYLSRYDEGLRHGQVASALLTRLHGDPIREARLLQLEGNILRSKGAYADARARYQRALEIQERIREPGHPLIAGCLSSLGEIENDLRDFDAAVAFYRRALAMDEKALGPDHPHVANVLNLMGLALGSQDQVEPALEAIQRGLDIRVRAFGADNIMVAGSLHALGEIYERRGDHDLAASTLRRALPIFDKQDPESPRTAIVHEALGVVLQSQGKYDEALQQARRALDIRRRALGPLHDDTARSLLLVGDLLGEQGSDAEALASYREGLAILEQALGPETVEVAMTLDQIGRVLGRMGQHAEAVATFARARAMLEKTPADRWHLGFNHLYLGEELARVGEHLQAIDELQLALGILERAFGVKSRYVSLPLVGIGTSRLALGAAHEAREPLERAVAVLQTTTQEPVELAEARFALARALWRAPGNRTRAATLARQARDGFGGSGASGQTRARSVDAWLAGHAISCATCAP